MERVKYLVNMDIERVRTRIEEIDRGLAELQAKLVTLGPALQDVKSDYTVLLSFVQNSTEVERIINVVKRECDRISFTLANIEEDYNKTTADIANYHTLKAGLLQEKANLELFLTTIA